MVLKFSSSFMQGGGVSKGLQGFLGFSEDFMETPESSI